MATNGIGSSVKRKEDLRFITGSGRYTDDIQVPHQAYACFVRSPHAHATIGSIDTAAAAAMPGVLGIFTGEDVAADGLGGLICGWMVKSKDGSPMKAGPHPILAHGKVRYVGDHVAVVVAETFQEARDAAEAVVVDYGVLPAAVEVARSHDSGVDVHADIPNNLVYDWEIGDKAATDAAFANAPRDPHPDHQQPPRPEPDGAAGRPRPLRARHRQLHPLHHQPEPARRPAGDLGLRRHRP